MRILCYILVVLFVTTSAVGQQINPVPDYIFRNSMSVGRNAPTDTSAYFSIGPRFGATRGFMPPMVVDTAAVTGTKRNGLLIYSIQRNSFLYWDSTGSRWSRIAANLDTLQLATRAWRQKGDDSLAARITSATDTLLLSTRAWRQKGIDSVASVRVGKTSNGIAGYFTRWDGTNTIDTGQIRQVNGLIGIGTGAVPVSILDIRQSTDNDAMLRVFNTNASSGTGRSIMRFATSRTDVSDASQMQFTDSNAFIATISADRAEGMKFFTGTMSSPTQSQRMRLDPSGNLSVTGNANIATTSGGIGVNISTTPLTALHIDRANVSDRGQITINGGSTGFSQISLYEGTTTSTDWVGQLISDNANNAVWLSAMKADGYIDFRSGGGSNIRQRIFANGRIGVNTSVDAGYQFDVAGSMRNTTGALLATSSGQVGIGTTTPSASYKMDVVGGDIRVREIRVGRGLADISSNVAVGALALDATTTATSTTAVGNSALKAVTSGIRNTAVGSDAGFNLLTSNNNVFVGYQAGNQLQTGANNTVVGTESMYSNVAGSSNISIGAAAMYSLRTSNNVAIGNNAGRWANRSETTAADSISNSIYIGFGAYSGSKTATNEIVIGSTADGNGSNTVTIGNSSITHNYFRGEMLVGYTSDQGAFSLQANGNALINGNIRTAAPAGGTANDWRLGTVATVSPTSPNRTIEVSIGGTIYYIHAKTTND